MTSIYVFRFLQLFFQHFALRRLNVASTTASLGFFFRVGERGGAEQDDGEYFKVLEEKEK